MLFRHIRIFWTILAFATCGLAAATCGQSPAPRTLGQTVPQNFAVLAKRVLPAVVSISVIEQGPDTDSSSGEGQNGLDSNGSTRDFEELLRHLFGDEGLSPLEARPVTVLGTGFVIDPAGYIVTNAHVVEDAQTITVIFENGDRQPAHIIGEDLLTDLALLKVETGSALPFVSWGDSDKVEPGNWVLAVGNSFGLGGTLIPGVVSARDRNIGSGPYDSFLQIDAAINLGDSGGPTFNLDGQVVGVMTAIYSTSGGSIGISFAIPSAIANPVIEQLRLHGKVERGWLGVSAQQVTEGIAEAFGLPKPAGALVTDVTPNSPASTVGLKQGDIILEFNGGTISTVRDLPKLVAQAPIGRSVEMSIWRDNRRMTLRPSITVMPVTPKATTRAHPKPAVAGLGLRLEALTAELRALLHLPATENGAFVAYIEPDSPFAAAGLQEGDIIEQIDRHAIRSPTDAEARLQNALRPGSGPVLLFVYRGKTHIYIAVKLDHDLHAK